MLKLIDSNGSWIRLSCTNTSTVYPVQVFIFLLVRVRTHTYILRAGATVRCTQCRARIGNWEGGFPGRKVVGGNKALGTALLRSLIWLARQMFYVYVRTTLGNNCGTGYVRRIGELAQARMRYDTSLSRNARGWRRLRSEPPATSLDSRRVILFMMAS